VPLGPDGDGVLLQKLTAYADHVAETLPAEFYREKQIHWILDIAEDGAGAELRDRRVPAKARDQALIQPVPYVQRSGTKVPPYLLVDTAEFVLGLPKTADKAEGPSEKEIAEAERRNAAYRELVLRWADGQAGDARADAVRTFFTSDALVRMKKDLPGIDAKDTVALMVGTQFLHKEPSVKELWALVARERKGGEVGLCLVCGEYGALLATIPEPVKKGAIPSAGGTNEGQLVSINTSAQGRNGVMQLANTPICDRCGARAMAGLNHLLSRPGHHHRMPGEGVMVWWTRENSEDTLEALLFGGEPDPAAISHAISVLHKVPGPVAGQLVSPDDFHSLTLGLNNARVVVREWLDLPVEQLQANLGAWYEDHGVHNGWTGETQYVPLWQLTLCMGRASGDRYVKDTAPHGMQTALVHSALHRAPLPAWVLPRLLLRIHADARVDAPRIALLRLILNRSPYPEDHLMPTLDPDQHDVPYLCGRAFAVLEAIQRAALPKLNTTLRDKHFRTAATAPGTTLTHLRFDAMAHLKRLRRDNKGAGIALENRLTEIFQGIDHLPVHLTPRQQARFVIGYEHERAADLAARRARKAEKDAREASHQPTTA
jgi:CRISPR-associated protein Csd1